MIASRAVPYAKTGRSGQTCRLPAAALYRLGHDVRVILPKYALIRLRPARIAAFLSPLGVWMGYGQEWAAVHQTRNAGVPVYFIESNKYFDRWGIYHDADFNEYRDNARRLASSPGRPCNCARI